MTARVRHPERVHDVSRRSHARVGGAADGCSGGAMATPRRRPSTTRRHDVSRRLGRRRGAAGAWRSWPSIGPRASLIRASAADYIARCCWATTSKDDALGRRVRRPSCSAQRARPRRRREVAPGAGNARARDQCADWRRSRSGAARARVGGQGAGRHRAAPDERCRRSLARLVDSARVVRRPGRGSARDASGFVELPGAARRRRSARRRTNTLVSCETFPDIAVEPCRAGWLEAERGSVDEARKRSTRRLQVDPNFALPVRGKGRARREGRPLPADAVDLWKKARSLEPGYPNIDQPDCRSRKTKGRRALGGRPFGA